MIQVDYLSEKDIIIHLTNNLLYLKLDTLQTTKAISNTISHSSSTIINQLSLD